MHHTETLTVPFTDEVACDVNAFENAVMAELDPETPPLPVSFTKAYAEHHDPHEIAEVVAARSADGRVLGTAWMSAPATDNLHLAFTRLAVAADQRRRGVATSLLAAYVAFAQRHDRTTLLLGADVLHPTGEAVAASLGARVGMRAHVNQLLLADVPDGLIDTWLAHPAPDYALEWVPDSDRPDAWLDDLCAVEDVLQNDAPMEDIPIEDRRTTPEQMRAKTERMRAMGRGWWTLVVRHRASGEPVGYTEMYFPAENPARGAQGATAVGAAHRGHALGRLLKATMLERVIRERPAITHIRTFNADSNDPMLAINSAMGFKPHIAAARWMIDRADAETWLEKRQ